MAITIGSGVSIGGGIAFTLGSAVDPYWSSTRLLLPGNGSNGANNNTFRDSSANNFTVTRVSTPTQGTRNPFSSAAPYSAATNGGSMYFDGSTDHLTVPDNAAFNFGTGDATVEFWFNSPGTSNNYPGIISSVDYNVSGSASIRFDNTGYKGKAFMYMNGGGDPVISSTSTIAYNTWNHIAIVRQGTSLKMYLNGTVNTSVTISASLGWYLSAGGLRIGRGFDVDGAGGYYPGYLSNIRLVKGTAVYTSDFTPSTTPLTAIANTSLLLSGTNAGIIDNTMNNNLVTRGNAGVSTAQSKWGGSSVYFDGSGDSLNMPWSSSLEFGSNNFTVEFWTYAIGGNSIYCGSADHHLAMSWNYGGASANRIGIWASTNGSSWNIFSADVGGNGVSTGTLSPNTWTHVALVRNGSAWALYLNGTSAWTGTSSATIVTRSTDAFRIAGPWPNVGPSEFNGYMNDFRITNGVARYTSNFSVPTEAFPIQG